MGWFKEIIGIRVGEAEGRWGRANEVLAASGEGADTSDGVEV